MPLAVEGFVIVALVLLPALLGVPLVRRFMPASFLRANLEVAEPIWAILGVTYGLLLGFMVVNLWGDLQQAQKTVQEEANDLLSLNELTYAYQDSTTKPPAEMREQIKTYAQQVVDVEWPELGHRRGDPGADATFDALWNMYRRLDLEVGSDVESYDESIKLMIALQKARNGRISAARNVVPTALWVVLLGGVAVMIGTMWFTGSKDLRTHLLMAAVLAISLASILFLIRAFNSPFGGDIRVDSEPIDLVLQRLQQQQ